MTLNSTPRLTISLDALLNNIEVIRRHTPADTSIIAVVKDSAYGCGSELIARTLYNEAAVRHFAVATPSEALFLRSRQISGSILIFGRVSPDQLHALQAKDCILSLSTIDDIYTWQHSRLPVRFHIEIDTGMCRTGIMPDDIPSLLQVLKESPHLQPEGIFTHFSSADVPGTETCDRQYTRFRQAIDLLRNNGYNPKSIHAANSAAVMRFTTDICTHVRPGIALYGCQPDPAQTFSDQLESVVTLTGNVVALRKVDAGTPVSYGGHYTTSQNTCIATIGIGYGQGVPRYLSNQGAILVGGRRYRIAGNVTMDYCMIDAGLSPLIKPGDEAVILGTQKNETITPDDIACTGNTIAYEVLCNIGQNVPRIYIHHGKPVATLESHIY